MSYEGYVQGICANGHYEEWDAYDTTETCTTCGAKFIHKHHVDETNGEAEPREVIETVPAEMYDLKAALESLRKVDADNVQVKIDEIIANTTPKELEERKVKFGKVIKYKY